VAPATVSARTVGWQRARLLSVPAPGIQAQLRAHVPPEIDTTPLAAADSAMYAAKQAGHNQVAFATPLRDMGLDAAWTPNPDAAPGTVRQEGAALAGGSPLSGHRVVIPTMHVHRLIRAEGRFLSRSRRVFLGVGRSQMRGSHMSECSLNRALQSTLAILTKVRSEDLAAPTPCVSWDVHALIRHFVGTARWWAAAVAGEDAAADVDYAAGDFVAAYEESIRIAVAAFAAEGALDKTIRLPFGEFPGAVLRDLAAMEQFTHGWDLARAIGYPADLDPETAAGLLSKARLAITDSYRGPNGEALFGPVVEAPADAAPADQLAAFLGRRV
jgi:uncharacterized protein (TIGR03086 family)